MKNPTIADVIENDELLEVARKAVEDRLVELRDARIFVLRRNGLTIAERDGSSSSVIRMGMETAMPIALKAIMQHMERGE